MKMKKVFSLITLVAGFIAAPVAAFADGDIVDIRVMDMDGMRFGDRNSLSGEKCSPSHPVVAGEEVCIRVRMLVRNYLAVNAGTQDPQTWAIKTSTGGDLVEGSGPALGLKIGDKDCWAQYSEQGVETWQWSGVPLDHKDDGTASANLGYFTDFYFKYTVQPGDMGLPVRLMNASGDAIESTATSATYAFKGINCGVTKYMWISDAGNANLCFKSEAIDPEYPGDDYPKADYNLEKEGLYIKTIDFDNNYANSEAGVWREVNSSGVKDNDATLVVSAGAKVSAVTTVYVWSSDDTKVVPVAWGQGTKVEEMSVSSGTKKYLTVQIPSGESTAKFKVKSVGGSVGETVQIYMSSSKGAVKTAVGENVDVAVSRTVKIVDNSPPQVVIRVDGETMQTVTANSSYSAYKACLQVRIDNDDTSLRTQSVTVKLNAVVSGDGNLTSLDKIYEKKYLRISESDSGLPNVDSEDGMVPSVTLPAGTSTKTLYVYVLGANENTQAKGIYFTPTVVLGDISVASSNAGATLYVNRQGDEGITVTSTDKDAVSGTLGGSISMAKTDTTAIKVYFKDTYRNMNVDTNYTFRLVGKGENAGKTFAQTNCTYLTAGYVMVNLRLTGPDSVQEGKNYNVDLYGESADGSTTTHIPFTLSVIDGKRSYIELVDGYSEVVGEGDSVSVKLGLNQAADSKKYIFILGETDNDGKSFDSTLKTKGAQISTTDYKTVPAAKTITFGDGVKGDTTITVKAGVGDTQTKPDNLDDNWEAGTIEFTITNKPPVVDVISVAGQTVVTDTDYGKTLNDSIALGIEKLFTLESVTDVSDDLSSLSVKWKIDGTTYETNNCSVADCVARHTFTTEKDSALVEVYVKDKDMDNYPKLPNVKCYVKVVRKPYIAITTSSIGGVLSENEQGSSSITVTLSTRPESTTPVTVYLKVQRPTDDVGGYLKLRETDGSVEFEENKDGYDIYLLTFQNQTEKIIPISDMDGTATTLSGLDVLAEPLGDYASFYDKGQLTTPVRLQNIAPEILRPSTAEEAYTNENASANTPYTIHYQASDVTADLTAEAGISVDVSVDGTSQKTDTIKDKKDHTCEVMFEGPGAHVVVVTFTDKDSMVSRATLNFYVKSSKVLNLSAHGPGVAYGSSGGYSQKYHGASGLGAGRVAAGDSSPQKISAFVHTYSFNPELSSTTAYAYGYKVKGGPDDGTLTPGKDYEIDIDGNWTRNTTIDNHYDYTNDNYTAGSKHKGYQGLDSFVYGWACNNTQSSSGGRDSETVTFALNIGESGSLVVSLPDEENSGNNSSSSSSTATKSYPIQYWEAIFSSELLATDNCGDINGDGVPDIFWQKYFYTATDSSSGSDGSTSLNDLDDVNYTSDSTEEGSSGSTTAYCADGDYLPTDDLSIYNSMIPGLPEGWKTTGKAFTPVLKIRGFPDEYLLGDGTAKPSALNNARELVGLNEGTKSEQNYTDPREDDNSTLSYVEWLAWQEYKAVHPNAKTSDWTPENPTDPTKSDSDNDGLTDGYEYWIWYMAHVGWVENYGTKNEVHRRLTGRKYNPANPGEGDRIAADELAKLFNPNSGTGSVTRDTDNDGLPDVLEFIIGTKPYDFDSDGDGLPDGWEVMIAGLNPSSSVTYANEPADRLLNMDGDAMAIGSYKLEAGQQPASLKLDECKRWTLAVVDKNGATDGVQWYAMAYEPELAVGGSVAEWWKVVIDGTNYCALTEPVVVSVSGTTRLASETTIYKIEEYTLPEEEEGGEGGEGEGEGGEKIQALGYPMILESGTIIDGIPEKAQASEELKKLKLKDAIDKAEANACWIYGKGSANALAGEVADSAAEYGCLALSRQLAIPSDDEHFVCALPSDKRDVAFIHFLCYQEFGFDPRTAWNANDPLAARWGTSVDGEALTGVHSSGQGKYTGMPSRTRDFTAYDEFLVSSFFYNNEGGWPSVIQVPITAKDASSLGRIWAGMTTNPQGPVQNDKAEEDDDDDDETSEYYYGRNSTEGADTDGDGVPDGWELYVMAGPKVEGKTKGVKDAYKFAPPFAGFTANDAEAEMPESFFSPFIDSAQSSDTCNPMYTGVTSEATSKQLNEYRKFSGTDSCNYYSAVQTGNSVAYSTTIVRPAADAKWLNKFFPADPWSDDTDKDGVTDGTEGASSSFIYGTPEDDGKLTSIPGGGLNPLSVDTDRDGLPDGWELQFKGTHASLYAGSDATYAKDEDGNAIGNALQGLTDGMDGTVADAYNYPNGTSISVGGYSVAQSVNRDYDHDGLDNWQEYLTGTMRCWRYDDPVSPMNGIPYETYFKTNEEGKLVFNAEQAAKDLKFEGGADEFWYKTLVDASSEWYNPHFVTDTSSGAQYFTRVENVWDWAYNDSEASNGQISGAYYWFYDRGNGEMLGNSWANRWKEALGVDGYDASPAKYASCSPMDPDSDHDGMDDYYELFHGMNPLLGRSGVNGQWWSVGGSGAKNDGEGFDIVYDSLASLSGNIPQAWGEGDTKDSYQNFWQRLWAKRSESKNAKTEDGEEPPADKWTGDVPRGTGYDFVFYPWLNGIATADADGDGTRNQEEAIMPLVSPTTAWHHTDPTALWMTDSSYSNSLVRSSYRMPIRTEEIPLEAASFEYGGKTYYFKNFDGYVADMAGVRFITFNPDNWNVATTQDKMNWIASFEENEGFDSDHDGLNDQDELDGKYRGQTDPIDADSPRRRQAMYFQGKAKPSILQTMPFVKEQHPDATVFNEYPDDLSFLHYTVECWVKADTLDDATILERAMWTDQSNPADREFLRCNFRLGMRSGRWYTKYDPNDTTASEVLAESDTEAVAGEWTHLAATYDGKKLTLYVNGESHGQRTSGLQPAYGSSAVTVDGLSGVHAAPGMTYWRDREYQLNAIVIGASFKNCLQGAKDGSALDVTRASGWNSYTNFFQGYIDEIRVWDGARSVTEIASDKDTRYTSAEVAQNREDFYNEWIQGTTVNGTYRGRYAKDESGEAYDLPAELRFHWSFDSAFGAPNDSTVAKIPAGFNYAGEDGKGGRAMLTRPEGYGITWWQKILQGYTGTVYDDKAWIVWIHNTVTHMPRFDGTTLDSRYWSEDFAGSEGGTYQFARTAEPVSFWTQYRRDGIEEGVIAFSGSGSRAYFVNAFDMTNNTSFADVYEFTGRHLNQSGDDMLALGGAFVKHVDNLWDDQGSSSNWEVSGHDEDGDGLPDWWEVHADRNYRDLQVTGDGEIDWNTMVVWPVQKDDENGSTATYMTAGEAYLRDLARGVHSNDDGTNAAKDEDGTWSAYRQRYDLDSNGLPDWWEELYGISGADMYADSDNDGLSNYAEFMLSEVFDFKGVRFSPVNARSVDPYTLDYFYKVGELYVGEIFTDHDQVEDDWEGLYPHAFGSRLVYDALKDADSDGWSNRSEARYAKQCQPTIAANQTHYTAADGLVADYPIPTLSLTLNYNGVNRAVASKASIGIRVRSGQLSGNEPDAEFSIGELGEEGETSETSETTAIDYTRMIGKWSNRHAIGTLTPGYINRDSIAIETCYDASAETYTWAIPTMRDYKRGDRAAYEADCRKYGERNVQLIVHETGYMSLSNLVLRTSDNSTLAKVEWAGLELGSIDLTTGAFDLDLGAFAGKYGMAGTNENDVVSMEDQSYRIVYSVNPAVDLPRKLYLGEADTGHVREGKNTIEAFMDLDGSGSFTPGEPYGIAKDVDVSWKGVSATIELTAQSPVTPRMTLWSATGGEESSGSSDSGSTIATDRGETVQDIYTKWGCSYTNNIIETATIPSSGDVRVRVVRWMVDGHPVSLCGAPQRVIYDKILSADVAESLTEDDFLSDDVFDLDWQYLSGEVANHSGVKLAGCSVVEVDYLVVIGDGAATFNSYRDTTTKVSALPIVISRKFGATRVKPTLVSPSASANQVVRETNPTFEWSVAEEAVKGYTAFKIQVNNAESNTVYDSGIQRVPARNVSGNYVWSAPLYVGDKTTKGLVYANDAKYTWKVSMYNAKYTNDVFSSEATYMQSVQTNGLEYGSLDVAVRYFGPSLSYQDRVIRVKAYESPDFTGLPVAAGYVAAPDDADTGVAVTGKTVKANCKVVGLPAGTYYLQAFIDSDGDDVCDDWESMGYLCSRDGSSSDWLSPVAITIGEKAGKTQLATIYLDDADTDGDSLPDAWEYAKYKDLTKEGVNTAAVSDVGQLVYAQSLAGDLEALAYNDVNAGLSGTILKSLASSASLASLALGTDVNSVGVAANGQIVAKACVEDGTLTISDFAFDAATKTVTFAVRASVDVPAAGLESPFYSLTVQQNAIVTIKVMHTDTLAGEWTEVGSKQNVTIGANGIESGLMSVTLPDISVTGGFFKIVVEQ